MANTARTLVTNALITGGIIEPTENAEDSEISHGLHELNILLDTLNQEKLFPFTSNRIDTRMVPSQDQLTIGEGEGIKLTQIVSNGATQVYTAKKDHGFQQGDLIKVFDTVNYNLMDVPVLEETERTFTVATQAIPTNTEEVATIDIPLPNEVSPSEALIFTSPSSFQVGDNLIVTDSNSYSVICTVDSITNPTTYIVTDIEAYEDGTGQPITGATRYSGGSAFLYADRVMFPKERKVGYVFPEEADVPDVRAQRPDTIDSMLLTFDTYQERIRFYPVNQWDEQPKYIASAGRPTSYTYYTSFPFGAIQLNPKPDTDYPVTIFYGSYICNLELDDELNLPQGYESTLQYLLADILCVNYKVDSPRVAQIAKERKATLKRNNYKPNVLESDLDRAGQYDIYGDQYL